MNTDSCGSGSRTAASERMKLGRAPAHPQSQAPVSSRAGRPYESRPGTCLAWEVSHHRSDQSPGGDSNSHASGARASEARASASSATRRVVQWSVRESNPPLQLEGLMSCADRRTDLHREPPVGGEGVEPSAYRLTIDGNGFTGRREEHHPREPSASGTGGSRTHRSPRFELGRFAGLRTVPFFPLSAPPMGFEPAISTLTGWRALRAAPRRRDRMAQEGFEPSASLVLSESGLPVAYRAEHLHPDASNPGTQGGSRTHRRPGLSRAAQPLAYLGPSRRKPWDSNPQAALTPPPVFKTGP